MHDRRLVNLEILHGTYTESPSAARLRAWSLAKNSGPPANFDALLGIGDQSADDYVRLNAAESVSELVDGINRAPGLFTSLHAVPEWLDWAAVERGCELHWRFAGVMGLVRLYGALTAGYAIPVLTTSRPTFRSFQLPQNKPTQCFNSSKLPVKFG